MRRIVVFQPGGHEALRLIEEPEPVPAPGQFRVKVAACGVNYADAIVRMGFYEAAKGRYPITPGFEYAGTVDAVGAGACAFQAGDRVLGITRFGGYTSSIVVSPAQLWHCPEQWTFEQAAAFPAVFLTAYYGLHRCAKVEPGETLLIHSAAGGVGTALLQLGKAAGCRAIGVVGAAHKVQVCKDLGADAVIDRSTQDLWVEADRLAPSGFDGVFDANGVTTLKKGFKRLAPGGRLVVYGFADILPRGKARPRLWDLAWNYLRVPKFSPLSMTTTNRAVMGFNVVYLFDRLDLAGRGMKMMLDLVAQGKIQAPAVTAFPLERAAAAHRAIESGTTTGKLALTC